MMSLEEVAGVIQREGLCYAICGHLDPDSIRDERLRLLWEEAEEALRKIIEFLEEETEVTLDEF